MFTPADKDGVSSLSPSSSPEKTSARTCPADVFAAALDCVITMDEAGRITGFNPAAEKTFGYLRADVLGRSLAETIIPPHARASHLQGLGRYLQTGSSTILNQRIEAEAMRADGSILPVELTVTKSIIDGETTFVGFLRDISDRKRSEEILRSSEAGYRSMYLANPHPMWVFDLETYAILSVNHAAIAQYGYSEEEFLRMTILDIRPPEDVPALLARKNSADGIERREGLWRHRRKNGEIIHVEVASHPILWEGTPARVVLVNDITDRKRVEDGLLAAHAELESRVHSRTAEVRRANVALQNEINDRRQAEEELRLSEARYRAIVQDQTEMICRYDADGVLSFVNEAHCRYFDLAAEEILGQSFLKYLTPDAAAEARARWARLGPDNPVVTFEIEGKSPTGEIRWQQWTERYLVGPTGAFECFQAVGRDITARKAIEIELQFANEELTRNEARLLNGNSIFTELTRLHVTSDTELKSALEQITEATSLLLDVARCSIWLYTEDGSHITCEDLYEMKEARHSRGVALSVKDFPNYFEHLNSRRSIVAHDAHRHPATFEFSEVYLRPLGIFSMLDVPIIIGGRMVGVLCCEQLDAPRRWQVEDQTFATSAGSICSVAIESYERARAESALRVARDEAESARGEAESANRAKSEFLSRMSHELRTPLNAILGFGQILEQQTLTPVQRESVEFVLKGGRHLLELINEVLDISRVEAGRIELSLEPVDVASLISEACSLVRPLADERGIQLESENLSLGCHVLSDRQRLRQVAINLLSNAIKYNRPSGRVEVFGEMTAAGRFRIGVRDTGHGIGEKDLRKLFTPFERLSATTSEIEGTGLGLAVSQRLMTAMGGSLEVSSVLGEGSTFFVELPLAQCPLSRVATVEEMFEGHAASASGRTWKVLYIEDNPSNLRLLEVFFQAWPEIEMLTALDGKAGLALAKEAEPDLILLDLHLPEMPGDEVLDRLKRSALTREIPVIVVSADATPAQIERLSEQGAAHFLTKPLDLSRFARILEDLLVEV